MKIKSYAKLNLTLEILGKNSSNMHEISGIFQNINLYDEIEISESHLDSVRMINYDISQENNLVFKTLKLIKNEFSIKNSFKVNIYKNIPVSSGLGGGSSNAAAMIYGLNKMMNLNLDISDMVSLSKKLGSDVPFFFFGGTCHVSGFGENIEKLNNIFIDELNLNTINLKINDKTKKMYGLVEAKNYSKDIERFDWKFMAPHYDELLKNIILKFKE